jgi:hypothetical protein
MIALSVSVSLLPSLPLSLPLSTYQRANIPRVAARYAPRPLLARLLPRYAPGRRERRGEIWLLINSCI